MRVDRRRVELVGADLSLRRDHHVGDHHQPVDCGIERAQAVAELLRQHRNDTTRKVDRG